MVVETNAVLWVGDPFVRLHDADENSNVDIDKVAEIFTDLAHRFGVSVHLVHHTNKHSSSDGAGNANSSRGASSFVNAMRLAHTLTTMSEDDAKLFGVDPEHRHWYVRLDDAKLNLAPPSSEIRWFKKVDVELTNSEHVGTLQRIQLEAVKRLSQYGHPYEVERASVVVPLNEDTPLVNVARLVAAATPGETRKDAIICGIIARYLEAQPDKRLTIGERTISLRVLATGKARYFMRAVPCEDGKANNQPSATPSDFTG
jgi:hypothetical protein